MRRKLFPAVVVLVPLMVFACGRDNEVPGPKPLEEIETDSAVATDTSVAVDAADAGPPDTGIRCTDQQLADTDYSMDAGGGPVTIMFPTGPDPMQYAPNCLTIKLGTNLDFEGDFTMHPLEGKGGDDPTLFNGATNQQHTFAIGKVGTYGWDCQLHPTIMYGAVKVVP